jgi:hypothetical protein
LSERFMRPLVVINITKVIKAPLLRGNGKSRSRERACGNRTKRQGDPLFGLIWPLLRNGLNQPAHAD